MTPTQIIARLKPFSLLALLVLAANVHAQDVALLAGQLKVHEKDQRTFAAALAYTHQVGDYAALSLAYQNEGHPQDHHRDGIGAQAWLRTKNSGDGLSFGVGAGPYFYFDTARTPSGDYSNDHGWAPMFSVAAAWHFPNRWYGQIQASRIFPHGKDSTTSLLVGAGYRFQGVPGSKLHLTGPSSDDTVTLSAGQTIVNSFDSERSRAASIEYRRAAGPYLDWSVTWLKEGSTARTRRNGVAAQLWLIRSLNSSVELGMGAGPYGAFELDDVEGRQSRLAGLVSVAGRYHFDQRWVGQMSWNRVVTDYHRDADVLLLGLGAVF